MGWNLSSAWQLMANLEMQLRDVRNGALPEGLGFVDSSLTLPLDDIREVLVVMVIGTWLSKAISIGQSFGRQQYLSGPCSIWTSW